MELLLPTLRKRKLRLLHGLLMGGGSCVLTPDMVEASSVETSSTNGRGTFVKLSTKAVGGDYITGRLPPEADTKNRKRVLTREANYHPDGGQVFFPQNGDAFVALLALPGDDVKPEDFVAFYFDGSFGVQIHANIWHQPVYPITNDAVFLGKQGSVHACVAVDTAIEFNKYLSVPLKVNK
ncbi:uncharacterized protein LOC117316853 [Pecten maximus]|uniref:uncharacterized protein LOC117316853 n=1 Tax=Pecten maximus TaxID=6579 RepID=UPI00145878E8|nr:uncharacterized protein LOC117316853 [Pecten maximus]